MLDFTTESPRKALLEKVRWYVSTVLGDDWDHKVDLHYNPHFQGFIATVTSMFMSRELEDEREVVKVPDGPWDQIKAGLNHYIDRFDRACRSRSIEGTPFRFKVKTRSITVKRVAHVCPHLTKKFPDHEAWLMASPAEQRMNFRAAHGIKAIAEEGLRYPHQAGQALHAILDRLQATGAFR